MSFCLPLSFSFIPFIHSFNHSFQIDSCCFLFLHFTPLSLPPPPSLSPNRVRDLKNLSIKQSARNISNSEEVTLKQQKRNPAFLKPEINVNSIYTHTRTRRHAHTHARTHARTHTQTHTHTHAHTHTYTHTHKPEQTITSKTIKTKYFLLTKTRVESAKTRASLW